ncbi:MAG: hypothetical protein ACLQNE_02580 [Thermoguttaceae bacterium]
MACHRFGRAKQAACPRRYCPQTSSRVGSSGKHDDGKHHNAATKTHADFWSAVACHRFGRAKQAERPRRFFPQTASRVG